MPNYFGGSIWEELAFCKLSNNDTECGCMGTLPARLRPRGRATHQQHHSHSSPAMHAHAPESVTLRGKEHFTGSSAGSSIQKQPHWAVSALPKADQSCSCLAWGSQRRRSEQRVLKEGKEGLGVPQRRKKNSKRHHREVEGSSSCRRVGIGVVGQGTLRSCRWGKLMASFCSGSREMHWKMQWKMCPPCQHHPGQEGSNITSVRGHHTSTTVGTAQ